MPKITQDNMVFVPKTWGWERWIINNDLYCGKILFIAKGHFCSYHYHKEKDEVLYIQEGKIVMYTNNLEGTEPLFDELVQGQAWHMKPCVAHQMYALEDTYIHEFSTHHEDSDSYRVSRELVIDPEKYH